MNISMIPNNDVKTIHASQNDTQRKWEFTPFANNKALVSDLPMYIKSLKGNTLVWNQLVQNGNFANTSGWSNSGGTSFTASNNEATFVGNQYTSFIQSMPKSCIGHKILAMATCKTNGTYSLFKIRKYTSSSAYTDTNADIPTSYQTLHQLITLDSNLTGVTLMFQNNANASATINVKNVMLFDLTAMGLDVTADQFRALFPLSYYQFDSGSLLSFNGTGIKTANADETEEHTTNLPVSTYFPTGMKSAGTVYDELTPTKAITRVGVVDLGTMTWTAPSNAGGSTATWTQGDVLSDAKYSTDPAIAFNGTCIYTIENANAVYSGTANEAICLNQVGRVQMRSSAFLNKTDAEVKTLLSGVYLYYELATPTEENVNLNLTYPIEDGGTEELLPSGLMNGSVDLGSLTWTYASNYKIFICDTFTGAKGTANQTQVPNMECAIYRIGSWSEIATDETKDMAVCCLASANQLRVRNLAYTDATTFKNAMSGITLWYEKSSSTPGTSPIRMDVVEPNGDNSTESFTFKATDASFANGTFTMVCKNLEIPLTVSKGKLTGTSVIGMTDEPGFFDAKLKMTDSDGVCYSTKFQLHVERKP